MDVCLCFCQRPGVRPTVNLFWCQIGNELMVFVRSVSDGVLSRAESCSCTVPPCGTVLVIVIER